MQLPPCGLYKTLTALGTIPSGRLVFFHNHGDPGPGLYLPKGWKHNRVELTERGVTLEDPQWLHKLEALPPEGFYRVSETFHCCEKRCRAFAPETLVQLGYDGNAQAILFSPQYQNGTLTVPESGAAIDASNFDKLKLLQVAMPSREKTAMH
jgi:hypothetical protein